MEGKMKAMNSKFLTILIAALMFVGSAHSETVATFADPSGNAANYLFTVNWSKMQITGGWADSKNGLDLVMPIIGDITKGNVWFEMKGLDDAPYLAITNVTTIFGQKFGQTSGGHIYFHEDSTTNSLLTIDFASAVVSYNVLGASDFSLNNVQIHSSLFPWSLSDEQFNFSFANGQQLSGDDGFTATASFTSSAVPEPATLALLGIGGVAMLRRRSR